MRRPALSLLIALLVSATAFGANAKATALAKDAEKLYKDNKYKEAAELLQQAFDADPVPKFLYNMARAYDQAGDLGPAMEAYRKYVGLPSDETDPDLAKKANLAMDRIRTLLAKDEADKKMQEAERNRLQGETKEAKARAEEESQKAKKQKEVFEAKEKAQHDEANKKLNTRKLITYGTAGASVVGFGLSLGFGFAAGAAKSSFVSAVTVQDKQKAQSATQGLAAVADVGLVIGLAGAVATAILWPKGPEPETSVSVALAPAPGGGFAVIGGRF